MFRLFISNSKRGWITSVGSVLVVFMMTQVAVSWIPFSKLPFANSKNTGFAAERVKEWELSSSNPDVILLGNSRIAYGVSSERFTAALRSESLNVSGFNLGIASSGLMTWSLILDNFLGSDLNRQRVIILFPWCDDLNAFFHINGVNYFWDHLSSYHLLSFNWNYPVRDSQRIPSWILQNNGLKLFYDQLRNLKYQFVERYEFAKFALKKALPSSRYKEDISNLFSGYTKLKLEKWVGSNLFFRRPQDGLLPEEPPKQGVLKYNLTALANPANRSAMHVDLDAPYEMGAWNILIDSVRRFLERNPKSKIVFGLLPFQPPYLNSYSERSRNWIRGLVEKEALRDSRVRLLDLQSDQTKNIYDLSDFDDQGEHFNQEGGAKLEIQISKFLRTLIKL